MPVGALALALGTLGISSPRPHVLFILADELVRAARRASAPPRAPCPSAPP